MKAELKPVLVSRVAERIHIQELGKPTDGTYAVPVDNGYRYIGDVATAQIVKDGLEVTRWFCWTLVDTTIGPFPNRVKAIEALLEWNGMVQVKPTETIPPLFDIG